MLICRCVGIQGDLLCMKYLIILSVIFCFLFLYFKFKIYLKVNVNLAFTWKSLHNNYLVKLLVTQCLMKWLVLQYNKRNSFIAILGTTVDKHLKFSTIFLP